MSDFFDFLFSEAPWLRPVLAWGLALLLACVILTPIAYFIVWPFFLKIREELAAFAAGLPERFDRERELRAKRLDEDADEFRADGGLWRLSFEPSAQWSSELRRVSAVLGNLGGLISKAIKALDSANQRVPELVRALQSSKVDPPLALPPLPSAKEIVGSVAGHRVAWLRLVLSGLILGAIMTVNTVMLSQILRDLGVIPPALTFLGAPLAYIVAFLMTGVEAGLGVGHSATRKPGEFTLWPYFFIVLAFGVSLVEGFFWSRIAPAHGVLTLPFVGYEMPQPSLFYCFGFALVWTLFGLGAIGFDSAAEVLRGRPGDLLRGAIDDLRGRYDTYVRVVTDTEKVLKGAVAASTDLDQKIQGPAANAESVREQLEKLDAEIRQRSETAPDWAKSEERELTRTEVYQLALTGGLWLTLTLIGATVMTVIGLGSFTHSMEPSLRWALAVGQAVAFLGVGGLLGAGETIVRRGPGEHERKVAAAPVLSRFLACAIGGALVGFYLVLAFTTIRGAEWIVNAILGLFLAAAGYHLNPLLNVVRLWLRRVWGLAVLIVQALWLAFVHVMRFLVVVLESVAYLFAAPLDKIRSWRGPKPPQPMPLANVAASGH
jgi:hypothetical protein